jgi:hypothetical protein
LNRFDWLEYLDVADLLLTHPSEGFWRSATSRAYYGVYCRLREIVERRIGRRLTGPESHREVMNHLRQDRRSTVSRMGQRLDRLRRERNVADYEPAPFTLDRADKSLIMARQIRDSLDLVGEP